MGIWTRASTSRRLVSAALATTSMVYTLPASAAHAAIPVVSTVISVEKTGSEPWDATSWDTSAGTNEGTDSTADDNVVRLQDSITYKIEASVNDSDVDNLISEVLLDPKQKWIQVPTGCKTDDGLNPVSQVVDSTTRAPGGDGRLLLCNFGPSVEGTNRVAYPPARAIGSSFDGTEITLNDDRVAASVSTYAVSDEGTSDIAVDGPTDTIVTADFRVNLTKELAVTELHPDTGLPLYRPSTKQDTAGRDGQVMEYIIKATYQSGSMIADSDEVTFLEDFTLLDYYSDNNTNNDGALSSGAVLYDWDPSSPACSLVGDHGASAAVSCTANSISGDFTGTGFGPDGVNDPTISIDLADIDVRDPDADANLFEIKVQVWHSDDEVRSHQSCTSGGSCETFTINGVGVYDSATGTSVGFNPVSTEDAANTNLANYGGSGEPHPDDTWATYPLTVQTPGSFSAYVSFHAMPWGANSKVAEQSAAPGEVIAVMNNVFDYRAIDGARTQVCDKIDTSIFEFAGFSPAPRQDLGYGFNHRVTNPAVNLFQGGPTSTRDGAPWSSYLYTNEPMTGLDELRDATCDDDVNGDGTVNIMDAAGVESSPSVPVDWYTNSADVPGGDAGVTRVRWESYYDLVAHKEFSPTHTQYSITTNYLHRIKPNAVGYGANNYIVNWMTERHDSGPGTSFSDWAQDTSASTDPTDVAFGYSRAHADRTILVSSSHSIAKQTLPAGVKVVRAGDEVEFLLTPRLNGSWDSSTKNTAEVRDTLPAKTSYVFGTERFSVDGGTTWLTYNEYQASSPAVEISNLSGNGHPAGVSPLEWDFESVDNGDQLPMIKYTVHVDDTVTSGRFRNTGRIRSPMGIDADFDGTADDAWALYDLSVKPEYGFDVIKTTSTSVFEVDEPFEFELIYKNLGGESYTSGNFIDILPWNGDGDVVSGGLSSSRTPGSDFDGTYSVTNLTGTEGETFYATEADPSTLSVDPCVSANRPAGYVPTYGDLCYSNYVNNGNLLPDGVAAGTGSTVWALCTSTGPVVCGSMDPEAVTAIRFQTTNIAASAGGRTVVIELTPAGNVGGTPALDSENKVTGASTGSVYTNTFGGRIPENSLLVISNDVSVTVVAGSIGDYVWIDANGDGIQDGDEAALAGVSVALLVEDPASPGSYIPFMVDDPTNPGTQIRYVVETDANGEYLFDQIPSGNYQVSVDTDTLPPGLSATFDSDGGGDSTSNITLYGPNTPDTANGLTRDDYTGVDDDDAQDFGYEPNQPLDATASIDIEKATNGVDADDPTGPAISVDGEVTWTYVVTNDGDLPLSDVTVTDSEGEAVSCDADGDGTFDGTNVIPFMFVDDTVTCEASGIATAGQYANTADVVGTPMHPIPITCDCDPADASTWPTNPAQYRPAVDGTGTALEDVTDSDDSHYFGTGAAIDIEKATNGTQADTGPGPLLDVDDAVIWTYVVTNTGNLPLRNVTVTDSEGVVVSCSGSADNVIAFLPVGGVVECEGTGIAVAGQYENTGSVAGGPMIPDPVTCGCDLGDPATWPTDPSLYVPATDDSGTDLPPVTDTDDSHYFAGTPEVDIEKSTNGVDSDVAPGESIGAGTAITWTYVVTNTGDLPLADVVVVDDRGVAVTCGSSAEGVIPFLAVGEAVTCTGSGTAVVGTYRNLGTVSGTPVLPNPETCDCDLGDPTSWPSDPTLYTPAADSSGVAIPDVTASDPSHYNGSAVQSGFSNQGHGTNAAPPSSLAFTGSNSTSRLVMFGGTLLAAGFALLGLRRRRTIA